MIGSMYRHVHAGVYLCTSSHDQDNSMNSDADFHVAAAAFIDSLGGRMFRESALLISAQML